MIALIVIFCGILFCVGYLVSGMHAAVVCLLTGLCIVLAFSIFSPGFVIVFGLVFGTVLFLGGIKVALISLLVITAAFLFIKSLG